MNSNSHSGDKVAVYAVPRRYDLATLLAVTVSFALLFWVLRILGASPVVFAVVVTFVALVGLAQALLFAGRAPRRASLVTGMVVGPALVVLDSFRTVHTATVTDLFLAMLWYAPIGYVLGALVGGVFLVADYLRRYIRQRYAKHRL
jgi:CDP-diglyceride synthetase